MVQDAQCVFDAPVVGPEIGHQLSQQSRSQAIHRSPSGIRAGSCPLGARFPANMPPRAGGVHLLPTVQGDPVALWALLMEPAVLRGIRRTACAQRIPPRPARSACAQALQAGGGLQVNRSTAQPTHTGARMSGNNGRGHYFLVSPGDVSVAGEAWPVCLILQDEAGFTAEKEITLCVAIVTIN